MNSDPHESAAWRAFGILDTDETAGFDEAARRDPSLLGASQEIDRLSAAIAAATVTPVKPHPGQLDRLHARLGLNVPKRRNWHAISGWSAAAAIALLAILDHTVMVRKNSFTVSNHPSPESPPVEVLSNEPVPAIVEAATPEELFVEESVTLPAIPPTIPSILGENDIVAKTKIETRRLIQQIEVLREQLADLEKRDQERFEVVPGMAMNVLIEMHPPGFVETTDPAIVDNKPPMTAFLGDALAAANAAADGRTVSPSFGTGPTALVPGGGAAGTTPSPPKPASAYPIYDPARDTGTIVVDNLPPKNPNESYNLWVTTKKGRDPVLVGELPESTAEGEDRFDFSLGDTGVVPAGFYMTKDRRGKSQPPSSANTILQGPN